MRFTLKNPRFLQYIDYQNVRKTEFLGCQSQDITADGISVTLPDNFVYEETYRIYLVRGLERAEIGRMKVSLGDAMQQAMQ